VVIYEPAMQKEPFFGSRVLHDPMASKQECDIIIANRMTSNKIFTRDLFGSD